MNRLVGKMRERVYGRPSRRGMREDRLAPVPQDGTEPVVIETSPGTRCKPCLTVQKDAEAFAACNALADELGPLNEPKKAFKILASSIGDEVNEVFGVMMFDIHLRYKGMAETGRGEPASVMAPILPTLQAAIAAGADSCIIYHVHPSGVKARPSQADIDTTDEFVRAFDAAGVKLLDHVIVGGDSRRRSYYSFAEDNRL